LLAVYSRHKHDTELNARMPALQAWFGPRAIGPASLGTLASGVGLAMAAHADFGALWLTLALSAFAAATFVSLTVRLPASARRKRATAAGDRAQIERAEQWLAWGSLVELAILYLAVLDMVMKPSAADTALWLAGAVSFELLLLGSTLGMLLGPRLKRSVS
jgi:hypothetical protein